MALEIPYRGEVGTISFILKDENDVVIPLSAVTSLTLTFKDKKTKGIINSRNAQNVLNANEHTLHATSGLLTWNMTANDNPIINADIAPGDIEEHLAEYVWTASGRTGKTKLSIFVRQTDDQILTVTTGQSIDTLYIKKGNNIRYADQFAGSDAGAKIQAAINDLSSTGGVVDARGLEGIQTATAIITISTKVTVLFGNLTLSSNANPNIDITGNGANLLGISSDDSGGSVIKNTGTGTTLRIGTGIAIRNINVENLALDGNNTGGKGIDCNAAGDMVIRHNRIINHKDDSVKVVSGIHIDFMDNRIAGASSGTRLTTAFGFNIDKDTSGTTSVRLINNYVSGYDNLIINNGQGTILIANIWEKSGGTITAIKNTANGFACYNDFFSDWLGTETQIIILASDGTAFINNVAGLSANPYNNIDLTGITDPRRINITIPFAPSLIPGMTTTQRDALTLRAGMIIYNTTTNTFQGYNGTTWNNL